MHPIEAWVNDLGHTEHKFEVVSDDASYRKYYRLILPEGKTFIIMDSSMQVESIYPFIDVSVRLLKAKVQIPRVYSQNLEHGYLLIEDLGNTHLADILNKQSHKLLYMKCIHEILKMQDADISGLEAYDEEFLMFEMELMQKWYLDQHLWITLDEEEQKSLDSVLELIRDEVLSQPQGYFVHRDFHSRNIMFAGRGKVSVIDYQDARIGAITYDLVSLLKDVYIRCDREKVLELVLEFKELKGGILKDVSDEQFIRWFDFMGLQRHIKILGIFARLKIRDNKPLYVEDIPLTLEYIREVIDIYDELKPLEVILDRVAEKA
ncbi:phosphotransferase [Sulfurovum sp. bin170]|uniref:aminoglycoside phosphotransferase family protein n=1 Tax=Sulfurovum sp. bin170 TaxID=2695268 RepID=UPI0013DFDFC2|nr:phosphotransferase [Sulfurovum sp. bin170]NEW60514.1 phosphotransferase [Sulfurovum sp. bin170]